MYQRDLSWETYLHRFGFKEDLSRGLQRISHPAITLASFSHLISSEEEIKSILEHTLAPQALYVEPRSVTPESLQASFDWGMGSLLWKMELPRPALSEVVAAVHGAPNPSITESRHKAEVAYLNGSYADALRALQTLESTSYQDFSIFLTTGHIFLFHQKPPELEKARAFYLKAGMAAMSKAPLFAGRALLWAAFVAYLQHDDISAQEYATRAVQVTPQWGEAWYMQARISAANHQPEQALPALEQAIRADRNYALRAAIDPDFLPIIPETTDFMEQLRRDARLKAETYGKSIAEDTSNSPLPSQEQANGQRMQNEVSERWRQDSYFGYLDAAGKMVRYKVYLDGLRLPERDTRLAETRRILGQLRGEMAEETLDPAFKEYFQKEIQAIESALVGVPSLAVAQACLNKANQAQTLWQLATSQAVLRGHTGEVSLIAFNPLGQWLASTARLDQNTRLWDIYTGEPETLIAGHLDDIHALCFNPDGTLLITGGGKAQGEDHTVRLWEIPSGRSHAILDGHTDAVTALAIDPTGKWLASASADAHIRLWNLPNGENGPVLVGHQGAVTCLAFTPDGKQLISGGEDQTLRIWDIETSEQVGILLGHEAALLQIFMTSDGQSLISCAKDHTIRIWDVQKHQLISVHEQPGPFTTIAHSADGLQMAWAITEDSKIRLWKLNQSTQPQDLTGHRGRVTALTFSPDGRWLASASEDGQVRLWDTTIGKGKAIRNGHSGAVHTLAFSPHGLLLASAGSDQSVRLWGMILNKNDSELVEAEAKELQEKAIQELRESQEKAERQRLAWIKEGRCEICGKKISLGDRIARRTRCKEHRQTG